MRDIPEAIEGRHKDVFDMRLVRDDIADDKPWP